MFPNDYNAVDVLRVMQYGDPEQRDVALISHLLVTSYTQDEAKTFYEKAFPEKKEELELFLTKYATAKTDKDSFTDVVRDLPSSFTLS